MRKSWMLAAVLGMFAVARAADIQDPVKLDPKHYTVELDNDMVRVLRVKYGPHEKSVMHDHPPNVAVFMSDGDVSFTTHDGKTVERTVKAGATQFDPGGQHLPENTGDKPFEVILIELKTKPAKTK